MSNCDHKLFYRRVNKKQRKKDDVISPKAFTPRPGEDGISVYLSSLICPLKVLDGECEKSGRHLAAFRECSTNPPLTIEQDKDDAAHWLIDYPHDEDELQVWAQGIADIARLKIRCIQKQITEILDDPLIACQKE